MERSVGSKKSVYCMLMTVLFYTTGFICSLRTALWLTMHALIPAISHLIALYYHPSSSSPSSPTPPSPGGGVPWFLSNVGKGAEDAAGLLFKLVRTAAGHDLLVPVPVPASMYHGSAAAVGSVGFPGWTFTGLALSSLVGAGSVLAYYYLVSKRTLNRLATLFFMLLWLTRCSRLYSAGRRHGPGVRSPAVSPPLCGGSGPAHPAQLLRLAAAPG